MEVWTVCRETTPLGSAQFVFGIVFVTSLHLIIALNPFQTLAL